MALPVYCASNCFRVQDDAGINTKKAKQVFRYEVVEAIGGRKTSGSAIWCGTQYVIPPRASCRPQLRAENLRPVPTSRT